MATNLTEESLANENKRETLAFWESLRKEPSVGIKGDVSYKMFMGDVFTFLYNGVPVTIKFDGTIQYFPAPIANYIEKVLSKTAETNQEHKVVSKL